MTGLYLTAICMELIDTDKAARDAMLQELDRPLHEDETKIEADARKMAAKVCRVVFGKDGAVT